MKIYKIIRDVYIKTLRRKKFVHRGLYAVAQNFLFPVWEHLLAFHTHPDDPLSVRFSMLSGGYERETVEVIKRLIKPGMTALDVGAHIGYYTRIFANFVGTSGRVIAFEPHPETFRLLIRNTARFRNVNALNVAAADKEAILTLHDSQLETGMSGLHDLDEYREWTRHLSTEFTPRARLGYPVRSFAVRGQPVDQCLQDLGITSVDFIKMDIEGAEMKALKGMRRLLNASSNLVMVIEFNPRLLQAFGISPQEAIEALRSYGFHSIEAIDNVPRPVNERTEEFLELTERLITSFSSLNLLCKKGT